MLIYYYRYPCVATVADYVLLLFILFFFIHRSFSETTRSIFAKFSGIVYSCVVWIIRSFKFILAPSCGDKRKKTAKTVKDNSNLKQTWTREIISLHFWRILFLMVWGQLRSICTIGWQNLYFCQICYILFAHSKTIQPICTKLPGELCTLK